MSILVCARPECTTSFMRRTCQKYCSTDCRLADKRCARCGDRYEARTVKAAYCLPCEAAISAERRARPDVRAAISATLREKNYGVTAEQFLAMEEAQGGACAICHQPETATRRGSIKALAVDHDHDTGRVRGLLCQRCNTAIGLLDDDPAVLLSAIDYLMRTV